MKIVYISSSCIPSRTANSIHVMKMCQAFSNNGHDVTLIAPNKNEKMDVGINDAYSYYAVKNCFKILKLPWLKIKGRGYIYGFQSGLIAKQMVPDIVYCRNAIGCFFSVYCGLPTIFESHMPLKYSGNVQAWMFLKVLTKKKLKKLVVISNALKEYYRKTYSLDTSIIKVAPDGADNVSELIQPIELNGGHNKFQIGYVGHLYSGKGMELITSIATHCQWANFHIVGGLENDIKYWKSICSGIDNIIFHGHVPHNQTVRYIKAFDVALLPNQDFVAPNGGNRNNISQWTSPLKAFEYMAAGKAIISSDLPVLQEIFFANYNAMLCPPEDGQKWVDSLKFLLSNKRYRKYIGNNAKKDFIEKYSWQKRAKSIIDDLV